MGKSHQESAITRDLRALPMERVQSELERTAARLCAAFKGQPWFDSYGTSSAWSNAAQRPRARIDIYVHRMPRGVRIPKTVLGARIKVHVLKGISLA